MQLSNREEEHLSQSGMHMDVAVMNERLVASRVFDAKLDSVNTRLAKHAPIIQNRCVEELTRRRSIDVAAIDQGHASVLEETDTPLDEHGVTLPSRHFNRTKLPRNMSRCGPELVEPVTEILYKKESMMIQLCLMTLSFC